MERISQSGITQAIIDRAHDLKNRYPNMTHKDIAENLYGGGYTHKLYSGATVGYLLKVHTQDEYLGLQHMRKTKAKKENTSDHAETVDDENYKYDNEESRVIDKNEYQAEIVDDDPANIDAEWQPSDEFYENESEKETANNGEVEKEPVNSIESLFENYLLCIGTGGYPDVPIAEKTQSIAAGIACVKKTLNSLYADLKAEIDFAPKERACSLETLGKIENVSENLDKTCTNILNIVVSLDCSITEMTEHMSKTNELLEHLVHLWDTPESNCANL